MTNLEFASGASKLHKKIGEVLFISPGFLGCTLMQEVHVQELFPQYNNGRDRYDWVIPQRFTVIEAMGVQHTKVQSFGGNAGEAIMNFKTQKFKDANKQEIAILNGWTYIAIPHTDLNNIDPEYLQLKYIESYNNLVVAGKHPVDKSIRHQELLEKARAYRKEQYQKQKVLKNEYKRSSSGTISSSDQEDT